MSDFDLPLFFNMSKQFLVIFDFFKTLLKGKILRSGEFFFLRRGRNWIPHGDIPRWNLLAPGLLFWFLFVIRWIYVFASLANRLLIDLPLIFLFADVAVVLYQVTQSLLVGSNWFCWSGE